LGDAKTIVQIKDSSSDITVPSIQDKKTLPPNLFYSIKDSFKIEDITVQVYGAILPCMKVGLGSQIMSRTGGGQVERII
jgi:hypothetical protein